jgi:hypothetical protein
MFRNLLLIVAIFGLGWGASFGAGMAIGQRGGPAAQAAAAPSGPGGQVVTGPGGAAGLGGAAGGLAGIAGAGGGQTRLATIGTVERVDGQAVYVAGPTGQPVKVALTDQTQITKQTQGTAADLTAGTRVAVQPQGQPAADGSVTAGVIAVVPEGAGGAGAAGQRAPAAGQQRGAGPGSGQPGGQPGGQPAGR